MAAPVLRVSVPRWERAARCAACALSIIISFYAFQVERAVERDPEYRALCDLSDWMQCSRVFSSRFRMALENILMLIEWRLDQREVACKSSEKKPLQRAQSPKLGPRQRTWKIIGVSRQSVLFLLLEATAVSYLVATGVSIIFLLGYIKTDVFKVLLQLTHKHV